MPRPPRTAPDAPLFHWQEDLAIEALQARRTALTERIRKLPRHSHKRIELETRLQALTAEQLALETQVRQ